MSEVGWKAGSKGHASEQVVSGLGHVSLVGYVRGPYGAGWLGLRDQTRLAFGPSQMGLMGQATRALHWPGWVVTMARLRMLDFILRAMGGILGY